MYPALPAQKSSDTLDDWVEVRLPQETQNIRPARQYCQMLVFDMLRIPKHPDISASFLFKDQSVNRVEFSGIVTATKHKREKVWYTIDDHSASIVCIYVHKDSHTEKCQTMATQLEECLKENIGAEDTELQVVRSMMDTIKPAVKKMEEMFSFGDNVMVKGRLTEFNDVRRVFADNIVLLKDRGSAMAAAACILSAYNFLYKPPNLGSSKCGAKENDLPFLSDLQKARLLHFLTLSNLSTSPCHTTADI